MVSLRIRFFQQNIAGHQKIFFRINRFIGWNTYDKYRTSSFIIFIFNGSFMYLHQFMAQMQPYPNAISRETALHKALKQFTLLLFRDAYSRIGYLNLQALLCLIHIYREQNCSTRRSVFESI